MITVFTTGCSKCKILESKLNDKGIEYVKCEDKEIMKEKGFRSVPQMQLDDGTILGFGKAVKYVNEYESN